MKLKENVMVKRTWGFCWATSQKCTLAARMPTTCIRTSCQAEGDDPSLLLSNGGATHLECYGPVLGSMSKRQMVLVEQDQ